MTDINKKVVSLAKELAPRMGEFRRDLHQHPELAFKEERTSEKVRRVLASEGIELPRISAQTGVLGILRGNFDNGPVVALRADMDALPIEEKTGKPYASENQGVMHACGHDGNTSVVLGAARILARLKDELPGIVKFIFQPAEEVFGGARAMIKAGVLDDPPVEHIFAMHGWPQLPTGSIGLYNGPYMASADRFNIELLAEGAHGAYPHNSADPVLAASELVQRLHCVISREFESGKRAVLSVCMINGGTAFNILPKKVELTGTIRCLGKGVREKLIESMQRVTKGIAAANACDFRFQCEPQVPSVVNSEKALMHLKASASKVINPEQVTELPVPSMGSEDFALYLEKVPQGAFIRLGVNPGNEKPAALHNDHFDYDDNALENGMAVLAQTVLDLK
jgi:amidohydrolase